MKTPSIRLILLGIAALSLVAIIAARRDSMRPQSFAYSLWDGYLFGQPEFPYSVGNWDKDRSTWSIKNSKSIAMILAREFPDWNEREVQELSALILDLSSKHHFPPALILSVIDVESSFNPEALSHKGAVGLMQIKPDTAEYVAAKMSIPYRGGRSLYDPKVNLYLSIHYMKVLREQFRDPHVYLAAYNYGPGAIAKMIRNGDPMPSNYYNKVMRSYHKYRNVVVNGT